MLEIQREKYEERSRLKAEGLSAEEIKDMEEDAKLPFRPAFVNGKRKQKRQEKVEEEYHEVPTAEFAFRRPKKK